MKWGAITRHHPSAFLLAAQLMSLGLYVAFEGVPSGQFLLGAFGMMIPLTFLNMMRHQDLDTTKVYLAKISESEAIRWMDILHNNILLISS